MPISGGRDYNGYRREVNRTKDRYEPARPFPHQSEYKPNEPIQNFLRPPAVIETFPPGPRTRADTCTIALHKNGAN